MNKDPLDPEREEERLSQREREYQELRDIVLQLKHWMGDPEATGKVRHRRGAHVGRAYQELCQALGRLDMARGEVDVEVEDDADLDEDLVEEGDE